MAITTLEDFRTEVRDWSNRDAEALPNNVVDRCLEFAADSAYRDLKIPPLEANIRYVVRAADNTSADLPTGVSANATIQANTESYGFSSVQFRIPDDAVTFIYLRTVNADQQPFSVVFNEKTDVRTYYDITAIKKNENYWTRHGSNILARGQFLQDGQILELHYHRRLPALNARYDVNLANYNAGRLETAAGVAIPAPNPAVTTLPTLADGTQGQYVPNWLRDENRKVLLFGALWQAFDYLNDMEDAQKYQQKFRQAIDELNTEDQMRTASGGNVQVNYTSYLI